MAKVDRGTQKRHVYKIVDSPVGRLTLVATDEGLAAILWENDRPRRVRLNIEAEDDRHPVLVETERQLEEYFAGQRKDVRVEAGSCGNGLSAQGVERAADDPVRRDAILRTDREANRQSRAPCAPSARQTAGIPSRSWRRATGSSDPRASSRGSPAGSTPRRICWRWRDLTTQDRWM